MHAAIIRQAAGTMYQGKLLAEGGLEARRSFIWQWIDLHRAVMEVFVVIGREIRGPEC